MFEVDMLETNLLKKEKFQKNPRQLEFRSTTWGVVRFLWKTRFEADMFEGEYVEITIFPEFLNT